jgi:hypothetical protein
MGIIPRAYNLKLRRWVRPMAEEHLQRQDADDLLHGLLVPVLPQTLGRSQS